jgi:hypothetical protein
MKASGRRGDDETPRNAREGIEVNNTEKMLRGNKKFKCEDPGCNGKVGFGTKEVLAAHMHLAHGR